MLYVDEAPTDIQVPSAVELAVTETEPGLTRRHRLGRRRQAGHARVRRRRARAAVRERGRPGARGHPLRRVRLARLPAVRRTDQRRAAVVALYQARRDRPSARRPARRATPAPSRASWSRASRRERAELDESDRAPRARAGRSTASRRSSATSCGWRSTSCCSRPDVPDEVAIDEAVEAAKELCSRGRARLRQRHPGRGPARGGGVAMKRAQSARARWPSELEAVADKLRAGDDRRRRGRRPASSAAPSWRARLGAEIDARHARLGGRVGGPGAPPLSARGARARPTRSSCSDKVDDYLEGLRFAAEPGTGRPRGGDALLAARRRQAHPPGAGARHRRGARPRRRRGAAARGARSR